MKIYAVIGRAVSISMYEHRYWIVKLFRSKKKAKDFVDTISKKVAKFCDMGKKYGRRQIIEDCGMYRTIRYEMQQEEEIAFLELKAMDQKITDSYEEISYSFDECELE